MTADVTIYFGTPGNLTTLPQPRGGVKTTRVRPTFAFGTGGGGMRVSKVVGGRRQYALNWQSLDLDTFSTLLEYDQGHRGAGPFALLDPGQRNMLTVNQSSTTSETNDADNFTVGGSGYTLTSESATYRRGPRSLKIGMAYSGDTGTVTLDAPTSTWYGVPVVASRALVFSYWARSGDANSIRTLTPRLNWYNAAGVALSTTSGTPVVTSSASWTQMYATGTPPASAAYVQPSLRVNPFLNADPFFETDASGWFSASAGIVRSTAQAHEGVASLLISPNGLAAAGGALANDYAPVTPSTVYTASLWAYSPGGHSDLRPAVDWHTSTSESYISSSLGSGFAVPAGVWTHLSASYTSPATAHGAVMRARHGGTPAASAVWYADEVGLALAATGVGVYVDQLQLEEGTTPGTWRPGTGVMPVQVLNVVEQWPFYHPELRDGPVMALQEVD